MSLNKSFIAIRTLRDVINGKEPSQELMKALTIGQTKTDKNGKVWIVKQTPSGKLDWRAHKVAGKKDAPTVKQKLKSIDELFDNDTFPELSDVKYVKDLGGSTGAKLVEDKNGNQFVMKQGDSDGHVEEEFLSNAIYKLMGVNVPTVKLYKGDGKNNRSTMLSAFMPNTVAANSIMDDQLRDDIVENYVLDCLLGNWDVYKNDNILVNTDDGSFVRVDNGGSMRYSAQGRLKGVDFDAEVRELDTMPLHNANMVSGLTDAKIKKQVKKILVKGPNILSIIEDDELRATMNERLMDLREMVSDEAKDPNRVLKERDLTKALRKAGSLHAKKDGIGWSFLSEICKIRSFTGVPEILEDDEFDVQMQHKDSLFLNRGMTGDSTRPVQYFMKHFIENEECFYGYTGIYGAGIYAAVNRAKQNPPPYNGDYGTALAYAGGYKEGVMDLILPHDAKVIDADELDQMMNDEFFGEEFKDKKIEYDKAMDDYNEMVKKSEAIEDAIDKDIRNKLGWNEKTMKILQNSSPETFYADTEKWGTDKALNYFKAVVESINGSVTVLDDDETYEFKLPNSNNKFWLNKPTAELSLKQKRPDTVPYNYHYVRLKEFIMKNHFGVIAGKVEEAVKDAKRNDPKMIAIKNSMDTSTQKIKVLADDISRLKTVGSSTIDAVMAEIIKRPGGENRGFYAAIKGYDAVIHKGGNGSTDYAVILNRSKIKVRKLK